MINYDGGTITKMDCLRDVIDEDYILGLSLQAQLLYIHLYVNCDEDHQVYKTKSIARKIGVEEAVLAELINNGLVHHVNKNVYQIFEEPRKI